MKGIFSQVENPLEIRRLLSKVCDDYVRAVVWLKGKGTLFNSFVTDPSSPKNGLFLNIPADIGSEIVKQLEQSQTEECFINLFLKNKAALCVRTRFLSCEPHSFKFSPPDLVLMAQRRRRLRLNILGGYAVDVSLLDPSTVSSITKRKMLDLGVGGLSFVASDRDSSSYRRGMYLGRVEFVIRGRKFSVCAEVAHSNATKIGLRFVAIDESDAEHIVAYISEHLAQYDQSELHIEIKTKK